ncbi:isotocin receptor-like [Pangasianodon hypophthalmus]|uniref:isotocin receptor-like n=1 Tax=Pangasianodon hypophthalmus TaxID=310915 RepID=UPI0023070DFA|nr:isotocin receptor-like [Pangasianodon hypophthalmus]
MENLQKDATFWPLNRSRSESSSGNESIAANRTENPLKRNEEVAKVEVAVLFVVLLLALAGNLCVLAALHASKRARSRMHFFMKHLSIADLVVAIFQVLPQLIWDITFRFYGPDFLCRLVKYLQVVGMFASTYLLVLMSVDRCLAVCQPLRSLRRRKDREYVLGSWLLSLLLSLPQTYIFSLKEVGQGVYDCWGDFVQPWGAKAYITWISLTIYIIPVTILSVCYGLTSFKIWQNFKQKSRKDQPLRLSGELADSAALSRVSSVRLWHQERVILLTREKMAFIITMLLASLNSCCNPWIYMFFAGHLFRDLMHNCLITLRCNCVGQQSPNGHAGEIVMKDTGSQRSLTQTSTM